MQEARGLAARGTRISPQVVEQLVRMLEGNRESRPQDVFGLNILTGRGRSIRPKTVNQKAYVDAIDTHTVIFGIGPAGTGKTYLAMAKAVQALQAKEVSRIILTRPAVEAGEKLGFLPGTLTEKIDPYLRPLYDALHEMVDPESIPRLIAAGTIEVAPLAYMRGRTLNDAFIILDEAQNTTPEQMKMFLTRLGFGSRIVVTGDITQVDLPGATKSGCGSSPRSCRAWRTSPSAGSTPPTSSATGWSGTSSTPTSAGRPERALPGPCRPPQGRTAAPPRPQEDSPCPWRSTTNPTSRPTSRPSPPWAGTSWTAHVHPEAEVSDHARGRGRDGAAARGVDGRARPHRRHVLPDGRAASGQPGQADPRRDCSATS